MFCTADRTGHIILSGHPESKAPCVFSTPSPPPLSGTHPSPFRLSGPSCELLPPSLSSHGTNLNACLASAISRISQPLMRNVFVGIMNNNGVSRVFCTHRSDTASRFKVHQGLEQGLPMIVIRSSLAF